MKTKLVKLTTNILRRRTETKSLLTVGLAVLMAISSILVNPAVAVHTALALPSTPVTLEAFNGTDTYFNISLSNVPSGYVVANRAYAGWCVDITAEMTRSPTIHQAMVYSSFNPPGELATQNWTMVNYILNHKQGNASDIQEAIWHFVNLGTGYSPTSDVALAIVNDTDAHGNGFVPKPGEIMAIICSPVVPLPPYTDVQVTVIELQLLIGDINGDGKVDMKDIGKSARAFGTRPGDASWDSDADITGPELLVPDGRVDMRDIGLIAKHFGEHY